MITGPQFVMFRCKYAHIDTFLDSLNANCREYNNHDNYDILMYNNRNANTYYNITHPYWQDKP